MIFSSEQTLSMGVPDPTTSIASEYAILRAVVQAAGDFLRHSELGEGIDGLLAGIGMATQASRAYVFENDMPAAGPATTATLYAEWVAPGIAANAGAPEVRRIGLDSEGFEHWYHAFIAGTPFVAVVDDLPPVPKERLRALQVQALAAVPIFVDGEFRGFLGVDSCATARRWTDVEIDALQAAAVVIGAAIGRRQTEAALREATVQARLAAEIGEVVTGSGDTVQEMLDRCNAAIVKHLQPDLVRLWLLSDTLECLAACTAAGAVPIQSADSPDLRIVTPALMEIAAARAVTFWRDGLPELWPGSDLTFAESGLRTGVGFPLVTNDRVAGVAVLLGREFPPRATIDALSSVTDEIALAIERHQTQGALARTELRYRRLVDATVEGIVIHNREVVLDANPSFAAMLGYTLDEIIGMHPMGFIPSEYHEFVYEQMLSGLQVPYEVEGIRRDGTRFPVELKGTDFVDQGVSLRVAAVRDITDRRAVQKTTEALHVEQQARALAEQTRARAEFLADASRVLASSLDTTTTLTQLAHLTVPALGDYCVVATFEEGIVRRVAAVHANPERAPLLEADMAAWPDVFPEDHPVAAAIAANRNYLAMEVTDETLTALGTSDAHLAYLRQLSPVSIIATPISSGDVVMGFMLFTSTTASRRFGEDDLTLAQELAQRAAQALQTARSYRDAQAASQARDEMLAVVAHDLRNPLNTIFMGSDLALELLGGTVDGPGVRQIEIIRRSAEQMNRLIQDLLDATRMDSGQLTLEKTALSPADIMRDACDMLAPLAAHAKIELEVLTAPGLPQISADKGRLLQVLSNLVGNALKFTPGGGRIVVSVMCETDVATRAQFVRFSVEDTGSGIPGEQLPHIFARGWQARRGDRRGIGLGLAIASGIVQAHGGRIWVNSRLGEGSTFLFTVPA